MKKILFAVAALFISTMSFAQGFGGGFGGGQGMNMNPEDMAKRQADRLKEQLELNQVQYDSIYNYYVANAKEQAARREQMQNGGGQPAQEDMQAMMEQMQKQRAAQEAKRRGVYVSFDINYRSKLWDISEASKVIKGFMPAVDLLFCGYGDLAPIFGVSSDLAGDDPDNIPDGAYLDVSRQMYERFGTTRIVFSMRRTIQADETEYGLRLTDAASGGMYDFRRYHIDAVDRDQGIARCARRRSTRSRCARRCACRSARRRCARRCGCGRTRRCTRCHRRCARRSCR